MKSRRIWQSPCGNYRIVKVRRAHGIKHYIPHWFALVRVHSFGKNVMWTFADKRSYYRKPGRALAAIKHHRYQWKRFVKLSYKKGRRDGNLKWGLERRYPRLFSSLPLWVLDAAEPGLVKMLFPDFDYRLKDELLQNLKRNKT